ncbi:kinetochore Sim4 complex subunit FTA2-domain-containing protein [Achaetomium macrosporum]|uniref:Kinetochore Sim4 complex subunit FTA2-domain-containing protein n=1 Tax=Achaetomium macrosporum TaxID=79813 RepID=A0AAN7C371_9PEZI|nr:kinetochore Sim4 complex subunit FTA2-domain-containing protein [Achaetomium macrosporum]
MSKKAIQANRALLLSKELPPDDHWTKNGPKLQAFATKQPLIKWLELLEKSSPESHSASEGYVFKVMIDSKLYALKFKFFKPSTHRYLLNNIIGKNITDQRLAFHTDPFYAECRAYGRIREAELKGCPRIAAKCYGFLRLTRRDELVLAERGIDLWEDIPEDDEYRQREEGSPIRAILKEFIEENESTPAMNLKTLKAIRKNIFALNRQGILHRDIRASNFVAGLLVDFGAAWTEPHCIIDAVPARLSQDWRDDDVCMFDEMVEELGFTLGDIRATPNPSYLKNLRSWNC